MGMRTDVAGGDPDLGAKLYQQMRRLARAHLRDGGRNTLLDTTALVHEAWLRVGPAGAAPHAATPWLAYLSKAMRSVIIDMARQRRRLKRGGDALIVTWTESASGGVQTPAEASAEAVLQLDTALTELERLDGRLARVVEMRYFAGLDDAAIAGALDVSERTVRRDWDKARRLLAEALQSR